MKILINKKIGPWSLEGWYLKENESGFWAKLSPENRVEFKFPWKLYDYKKLEEK